jgi:nucleoside-diphosphate kinase
MMAPEKEQTLVLIKPDALKNSLTGYILTELSESHTGLLVAGSKIVHVSDMLATEHYYEHKSKAFFPSLLEYISGKHHFPNEPQKHIVKAFVFQGPNAIKKIREIAGPTNPHVARDTKPGSIRALGTVIPVTDASGKKIDDFIDNLVHASANEVDAEREIKLWFTPSDIPFALRSYDTVVSADHVYYKDGKLSENYVEGSFCLMAPGDIVWKTDADALKLILAGKESTITIDSIAAKYLINNI